MPRPKSEHPNIEPNLIETPTGTMDTDPLIDLPITTDFTEASQALYNKAVKDLNALKNIRTDTRRNVISAFRKVCAMVSNLERRTEQTDETIQGITPQVEDMITPHLTQLQELIHEISIKITKIEEKITLQEQQMETIAINITQITDQLQNQTQIQTQIPTYAEIAATTATINRNKTKQNMTTPTPPRPHHSLMITSFNQFDTSENIVDKLRIALDARNTGIQIQNIRKIRDQRVLLSFSTMEELNKVQEKLASNKELETQHVMNKNPLIIMKNVYTHNTDEQIIDSIQKQNPTIIQHLKNEEINSIIIKYKRRTRNPHKITSYFKFHLDYGRH